MSPPTTSAANTRRLAIAVRGVIQGVGFRPFVFNAARARGLTGWVLNEADTVLIEVQGEHDRLDAFLEALRQTHPPQARVEGLEVAEAPCRDGERAFEIRTSTGQALPRPTIPADLATCAACLEEVRTPGERRFHYPFTNCTNCGPRWSIIAQLPYDRARTSMARFRMCPECRAEYEDPADRRFHAQPIACPACGPVLRLVDAAGAPLAEADRALAGAAEAVRGGRIVAMKGLGGFQLLCDATSSEAVARLRRRKRRPDKPLAVMLASLAEVRRHCDVSEQEAVAICSHEAPILLLRRRVPHPDALPSPPAAIAENVAPGNPNLGVMLPYTPLHHLLLEAAGRPIVCTSGNLSEEPMAIATADALERLGTIADVFLAHDRPILRPVDDSVAQVGADGLQVLRRARGFAPLPIELGFKAPTILAVGGHLKNAVALSLGSQVVLSPHGGDLDSVAGVEVHRQAIADMLSFFQVVPEAVACDMHPDYASTRHAETLAATWGVPLVRVQHHHAHVAACVAEQPLDGAEGADPEGPVLGFSWDGTGYGPDGTVWGGEVLRCGPAEFERVAHLRTFALPGSDRAVREPRRSALGLLFEMLGPEAGSIAAPWFTPRELDALLSMLGRSVRTPRTSSMGRLFDAVAALLGFPAVINFEGQAAMAVEFAAREGPAEAYPLRVVDAAPAVIDWEPMVRAMLADRRAGVPAGTISARFHHALAAACVAVAQRSGCARVALTGGCFQNSLLERLVRGRLAAAGFNVYTHHRVPPGDGGIALGQIAVAAQQLRIGG